MYLYLGLEVFSQKPRDVLDVIDLLLLKTISDVKGGSLKTRDV